MSEVLQSASEADLHAWQVLGPLLARGPYLPWTSGSLRPAALVAICNEIVHGGRGRILECGSGMSTVVLARLLRERGGTELVAIEHDRHWAGLVEDQVRREGLDAIARVVHAPLVGEPPWYDLQDAELPDQVDLLLVDGPPAFEPGHETRRVPALPRLEGRLADGATVILDDIDRDGEREVLALWERTTDWRFTPDEATGTASGRLIA